MSDLPDRLNELASLEGYYYSNADVSQALYDAAARIRELEAALTAATDFVDRHSEPWYRSGQALLAKCRAALGASTTHIPNKQV